MEAAVVTHPNTLATFAGAWAEHEQTGARLALAVRQLELSGEWSLDGYLSMAAWLRSNCSMSVRNATTLINNARFLTNNAAVGSAAVSGRLSAAQINLIRAAVTPTTEALFSEHEHMLINAVAALSVADTAVAMQLWRERAEAIIETSAPSIDPERSLSWGLANDGTLVGRFILDPAGTAEFTHAIGTAHSWDTDDTRSTTQRRADPLVDICAFFNANHAKAGTPRHRPHIELTIDQLDQPIGITPDNTVLGVTTTEMLLCDAVIHRIITAGNTILNYGRQVRTVPPNLFRAVANRDRGCRGPGCDRPVAWCDAHHLHHWTNGGETNIDNLALLCNRHHHLTHTQHIDIKILPDGTAHFTWPSGRTTTTQPHQPGAPPGVP